MILGIIGGGASGMAAALTAAQNPNIQVLLLEAQARVGRKLQATGNGRCNLSNMNASVQHYHGEAPSFVQPALENMNVQQTLSWFGDLGLFTVAEESGKVYPYSDQANSVVDVLRMALEKPNIQLRTGITVDKIQPTERGFELTAGEESLFCHKLIVACGGLAGTKLGGSMSGYKLLSKLGHKTTRLRPSLVQLKSPWGALASLKGIRTQCGVVIYHNGREFARSTGQLQFTEYGLSGPVIFQVSRDVCQGGGDWTARLDFLPHVSCEDLTQALESRKENCPREELLTGVLHNRLGRVLVKAAGTWEISQIAHTVKCFEVTLTEPMGMENAQVTAGGVQTKDFDPNTLESRLIPGLYACGEVLDIDGDCGGYNLQWAWSSGCLAGEAAGKDAL